MFRTFRLRLLFWFLVFISSSIIIIILSISYLSLREEIFSKSERIDKAYLSFLKSLQAQKDYFSYETKNPYYFLSGESFNMENYKTSIDSAKNILSSSDFKNESQIKIRLKSQLESLKETENLFYSLTKKIKKRGFKDYSLVGEMRKEAHWLEDSSKFPKADILSLRRHEKDYIIRNEPDYVSKFLFLITKLKEVKVSKVNTEAFAHLENYKTKFLELVQIDKEIGIKDNSGQKLELDNKTKSLEVGFSELVNLTSQWARNEFDKLTLYFGLTVFLLLIVSIIISAFIAHKITKPLTDLTSHISLFVKSNFTLETDHPEVKTKDEIGHLTKNFSILKNEVISQMKFFKQRVEERTIELANANERLEKLSKANSRFVPEEFIQNLGKNSIEEVSLGDQVEKEMTVVFTDIRCFTKISEGLNPQENFDFLNDYLEGIIPIISKNGGFIDKFIGDSVMSLFPNKPDDAIKAVMEFEVFLKEFNSNLNQKRGIQPINIGSGIHTGKMILGTIGHEDRLETTVISDAVNTAARVERLSKFYECPIIVSENSILKLSKPKEFEFRFLDNVIVKGKSKSLMVFQILTNEDNIKKQYYEEYHESIELMREGEYQKAKNLFLKLLKINSNDKAIKRFLEKCDNVLSGKISENINITEMKHK